MRIKPFIKIFPHTKIKKLLIWHNNFKILRVIHNWKFKLFKKGLEKKLKINLALKIII